MKIISIFVGMIIFSIAMFILFSSINKNGDKQFKYIKWILYCILEVIIAIITLIIML